MLARRKRGGTVTTGDGATGNRELAKTVGSIAITRTAMQKPGSLLDHLRLGETKPGAQH